MRACASLTHSEILLASSRLAGWELPVKMTRLSLVWFMSPGPRPLPSVRSGSGSLGTHAALSPSCSAEMGRDSLFSINVSTLEENEKEEEEEAGEEEEQERCLH